AFTWQVNDSCAACNGDGQAQRGEVVELLLDVTNVGKGKALDSFAQIKNAADQNIFIEKGRFKVGELAPGETRTARFRLEVKKGYKGEAFQLKLAIIDEPLEEFASEKLSIPVGEPGPVLEVRKGVVRVSEKAEVLGSVDPAGQPLARLPKGAVLTELGRAGGLVKVEWDKDRFAFVKASDAKETKGIRAAPPKEIDRVVYREPPQITLSVDPAQGGTVADGDHFVLSGVVNNPKALLDVYVLVNDQKVFFKGAGPEAGDAPTLKFSANFALKEGSNHVLVVARESQDFASRKTLVIRRRPATVAQKVGNLEVKQ
ncbi:MAG: MXAN_5808 family serine peptidase, partial [Myxococcaceae bacterium]